LTVLDGAETLNRRRALGVVGYLIRPCSPVGLIGITDTFDAGISDLANRKALPIFTFNSPSFYPPARRKPYDLIIKIVMK
jgi:hypothetical protein